ncbi:ADP-ribosylation factor-like protein 16 isoform X1 [Callorhinus ursinus]|uniref:ADP-ribosylation factor-like protein 16 isoform X1 n=2 Tax=Callorhinus ursinus TaxID=34884 RepID=A0A3Q7NAI8_CALUR|nr:ADP-ribosylation factor-like protein 16 isoform X1 [Callorhinus ursinus]
MCLLLGASGVGKTLLVKRLLKLSSGDGKGDLGDPPPTRPTVGRPSPAGLAEAGTFYGLQSALGCFKWKLECGGSVCECNPREVGTDLTDIVVPRKITIRELGGCMGPIWPSYYGNCRSLLFMMDAANPTQLSASCVQLLGLLSAEGLAEASVLILFNKIDMPCYMTVEEMKSLIRLPDIIACAKQSISTVAVSAHKGTGLAEVLHWLQDTQGTDS